MDCNRHTYFSAFYHIVFSTKEREPLLRDDVRVRTQQYIIGFSNKHKVRVMAINGMPDHLHFLIYVQSPALVISDYMRELKKATNKLINEQMGYRGRFRWQEGYFCQAISRERVDSCCRYIQNQQEHHKKLSFHDEWLAIMYGVSNDERQSNS